jgi:hypothetical protein
MHTQFHSPVRSLSRAADAGPTDLRLMTMLAQAPEWPTRHQAAIPWSRAL